MVPGDYHEFFVATATVAGALVGLLFVAISVRPAAAARTAHITVRLRSITALSAFLDTLFLSLLALRPRAGLGGVCLGLGAAGLVTMVVLLGLLAVEGRDQPWRLARGALLVVGQGVLYGVQVRDGLQLVADPGAVAALDSEATVVIILFALGLARAWDFVGADNPSLLAALGRISGRSGTSGDRERSPTPARPAPHDAPESSGPPYDPPP